MACGVVPQIYPKTGFPRGAGNDNAPGSRSGKGPAKVVRPESFPRGMKTLLTRLWFLIILSSSTVAVGIVLTLRTQELLWLAVAGSVLTVLGAIAASRKLIRLGMAELLVSNVPTGGGAILPTEDDLNLARQKDLDDRAAMLATVLVLVGTPLQIIGYLVAG